MSAVAWPAVQVLPDQLALPQLVAVALGIGAVFVALVVLLGLEPDDRTIIDRLARRARRLRDRVRRKPSHHPKVEEASAPWS